jgi:hypothetical protein
MIPAPPASSVTLFDLETKQPIPARQSDKAWRIALEPTSHDFLLLIGDKSERH